MKTLPLILLGCLLAGSVRAGTNVGTHLTVRLTDGSQLVGKPVAPDMVWELTTEAMGLLMIPVAKTDSVEFANDRSHVTLRLGNGDVLRGQLGPAEWSLDTLLGRLKISWAVVTSLQVRQVGGADRLFSPDDWEPLPFPVTCDWPGPKGELSRATDKGIEMRGHPLRTRQILPYPFTWECEVEGQEQGQGPEGCDLNFFFFPGGVKPDEEPSTTIHFRLNARADRNELTLYPSIHESVGDKRRSREIWRGAAVPFAFGESYRVRLEFERDKVNVTVNDRTETVRGITVEMRDAHIQLWNWQPTSRWLVHNPRAR